MEIEVRNLVHKILPLEPIMSHMNAVNTLMCHICKIHSIHFPINAYIPVVIIKFMFSD